MGKDAGSDTASAAVNVVESIGASMFASTTPTTPDKDTGDSNSGESNSGGGSGGSGDAKKPEKKNEIKTDTMTIVPTPLTEDTRTNPVTLDFGGDDDVDDTDKTADGSTSGDDGTKKEEPKEEALPATEAPVIAAPVQSETEEKAPTEAPVLKVVKATRPPPVKKIVKVKMPPL